MPVLALAVPGAFILAALVTVCVAACRMQARRVDFQASVWKLASCRITIVSGWDQDPAEQAEPEP